MKAISTILVVILLVIIIVSIIALFWLFSSSMFGKVSESAETSTINTMKNINYCMSIVRMSKNKIIVRNCGMETITADKLTVFMDGRYFDFSLSSSEIATGSVASLSISLWGVKLGNHELIMSVGGFVLEKKVNVNRPSGPEIVLDARFDEGLGKTYDSSFYNNNIDINGPTWTSNGMYENALIFRGISPPYGSVGVNDSEVIRLGKIIQVDTWIKTSAILSNRMAIADRYGGLEPSEYGWLLVITNEGKLKFHIGEISGLYVDVVGTTDLRDGKWHYVTGNYNGSYVKVFVDGKLEGITPYTGNIWNESAGVGFYGLTIGATEDCDCGGEESSYFDGTIDELRIFNSAEEPPKYLYLVD